MPVETTTQRESLAANGKLICEHCRHQGILIGGLVDLVN